MIEPSSSRLAGRCADATRCAKVLRGVAGLRRGSVVVVVVAAARPRPAASIGGVLAYGSRRRRVWQSRRDDAGSQQSSRHGRSAGAHLTAAGDEDHAHESYH